MKFKHLLLAFGMAAPLCLHAVPADPVPLKVTNPDGSQSVIVNRGDEFFNYVTDADNNKILTRNAEGFWVPMTVNGRQLQAVESDLQYLRSQKMDPRNIEETELTRMGQLDDDGRTTYPTVGEVRSLVILMQYKDTKFAIPNVRQAYIDKLNKEGYSDYGACGSAQDYFLAVSNGKFHVTFDVSSIVTLPETSAYYVAHGVEGVPSPGTTGRFPEALQYAVKQLDDEIDFSQYDYDDDGIIDNIFFYYAGYGQANSPYSDTIWPHQSDYTQYTRPEYADYYYNIDVEDVIVDGKKFATYACGNELNYRSGPNPSNPFMDGIGTFCHEYGHVLGFPDFYDTGNRETTETPGDFDLMCSGSYNNNSTEPPALSGYERWVCHWLEYEQFEENGDFTLQSLATSNKAYRINIPTRTGTAYKNEYFVLEVRGNERWDATLPDHGIAIWHVRYNSSAWRGNRPNTNNDPRYRLLRPAGSGNRRWCWDEENPFNYPSTPYSLTPKDVPSTWFTYMLTDMAFDEDTNIGSFHYTTEVETNDVVTTFKQPFYKDSYNRDVILSWEPVEGARDYMLTVMRFRANGAIVYVNNMNETSVGNITEYRLAALDSQSWNGDVTVMLKVVMAIPSSKSSDPVMFVPKDLAEYDSAVDDLYGEEDAEIYGVKGGIVAPESAEVYSLSGVRYGKENLPAGIYIVRHGSKAVKVAVK